MPWALGSLCLVVWVWVAYLDVFAPSGLDRQVIVKQTLYAHDVLHTQLHAQDGSTRIQLYAPTLSIHRF